MFILARVRRTDRANRMYRNRDIENSKKYIERRNEIITYRLMILFGVAVCAVGFFIYAMNLSWDETQKLDDMSLAGLIFTGALLVGASAFLAYRKTQKIDESEKVVFGAGFFAVAALLFASDLAIFLTRQRWIPFLTAFAIVATALAYIYCLYQREFFCFSVFAALGCFLLYLSQSSLLSPYAKIWFKAMVAACAVFLLVFSLALASGKGRLKSGALGVNKKIFEKNAKYFQLYILSFLIAGFAAVSFLPVDLNFFYMACALVGYFVAVGIYFTVKMI